MNKSSKVLMIILIGLSLAGYQWFTNNSAWQIINQNGGSVYLYEGTTSGHVDLSVVFEDPFGGTIYVSDQVH